jgi:hypothetical protein
LKIGGRSEDHFEYCILLRHLADDSSSLAQRTGKVARLTSEWNSSVVSSFEAAVAARFLNLEKSPGGKIRFVFEFGVQARTVSSGAAKRTDIDLSVSCHAVACRRASDLLIIGHVFNP